MVKHYISYSFNVIMQNRNKADGIQSKELHTVPKEQQASRLSCCSTINTLTC